MTLALLTVTLRFPENGSLKEKRALLQSLFQKLRREHNVSVAEVGDQDLWRQSVLAVAHVNTSGREADSTLARILNGIENWHAAEVIGAEIEMR